LSPNWLRRPRARRDQFFITIAGQLRIIVVGAETFSLGGSNKKNRRPFMCGFHGLADASRDLQRLFQGNCASLNAIGERLAFDEFKYEIFRAIRFLTIVNRSEGP
jgi:hypothetical protein